MSRYKDITGHRSGRLIAIAYSHSDQRGSAYWRCKCDCGREKVARMDRLLLFNTKSCGCLRAKTQYRTKNGNARPEPRPVNPVQLNGFTPEEAAAIEAFVAAGRVKRVRPGEWPDALPLGGWKRGHRSAV